ncbi:MAG: N-acetylneuraminate synthase [Flavobacteriales bacterium]
MAVIIIAEAGVNHNGDYDKALALIDAAAEAGADYVKFQTFKATKLASASAKKADYQAKNIGDDDDSQFEMLRKLELPEAWHHDLKTYAEEQGIKFLSTGFDEDSMDFLIELGIDFIKIPSGEITNKPYLQHAASKGLPIVISTGMSNIEEIREALSVLTSVGLPKEKIVVLHCNTEYPTPMSDVNLTAMQHIRRELHVQVGYSDHTLGIEVPIAAVALGAIVIEKHFTLDRTLPGPDHAASLEPEQLKDMVQSIRNIETAINGSGIKEASASETKNIPIARKSIHALIDIPANTRIEKNMLIMRRPGDGISPMRIDEIIGKETSRTISADTTLTWEDLKK